MKSFAALAVFLMAACTTRSPPTAAPSTGPLTTEDQKSLYALGYLMGSSLQPFSLTPAELQVVTDGASDSVHGAQSRVDLGAFRPKVQAMAMTRGRVAAEARKQKDAPLLAKAAAEPGAEKLPSGVIVQQLSPGTGDSPTPTDSVKVDYEGKLLGDGSVFDSSLARGVPGTLSLQRVVKCWSEGLQKLKVGEKAKLTCPSDTAYGDAGHPPKIPGGAALTFEVTLREITKGAPMPQVASAAGRPGSTGSTGHAPSPPANANPPAPGVTGAKASPSAHGRAAKAVPKR